MMQRLARMPRASACLPVFLFSCIYYVLSDSLMRIASRVIAPGNCLGNHAMCVSHAVRMSHDLPVGSIKIAIAAALLLILF